MNMKSFIAITKALSDGNRVRALAALRSGELCVCQIIELLGLAPSTVSKHMSILKQAGLVESRKEGRWIFFRFSSLDNKETIRWVTSSILGSPEIIADDGCLKKISRANLDVLCKKHRNGSC